MRHSGMSAVSACASVRDRIHSSSSNICVELEATLFRDISSGPLSRILKSRLHRPAPAKAMTASRCSCYSPEGLGHSCASSTWGSDAIPVLLRPSVYLPPLQAARAPCSVPVVCVPRPEFQGVEAVVHSFLYYFVPAAPPPTSPFTTLLSDLLAVRAQGLLLRCSSVCGRFVFFSLFCCPVCC